MGELVATATPGQGLVALGLGSCIGLVLLDRRTRVAGLAHIVLPGGEGQPGLKFADNAVPELVSQVVALGGRKPMLEAALVGGASMFATGGGSLEVGRRNETAVREALVRARIKVVAEATGGKRGRTVRVDPAAGLVTVREAGAADVQLYPAVSASPRQLQEVA
jgi:chemotaxis protein CheD